MKLLKFLVLLIKNPHLYVAASIAAIPGGLAGSAVGMLAGGAMAVRYQWCMNCTGQFLGFDNNMISGGLIGIILGAIIGGACTIIYAVVRIHPETKHLADLDKANIMTTWFRALELSVDLTIGMAIGALIGSLKSPGTGTLIGALIGMIGMAFIRRRHAKQHSRPTSSYLEQSD